MVLDTCWASILPPTMKPQCIHVICACAWSIFPYSFASGPVSFFPCSWPHVWSRYFPLQCLKSRWQQSLQLGLQGPFTNYDPSYLLVSVPSAIYFHLKVTSGHLNQLSTHPVFSRSAPYASGFNRSLLASWISGPAFVWAKVPTNNPTW